MGHTSPKLATPLINGGLGLRRSEITMGHTSPKLATPLINGDLGLRRSEITMGHTVLSFYDFLLNCSSVACG